MNKLNKFNVFVSSPNNLFDNHPHISIEVSMMEKRTYSEVWIGLQLNYTTNLNWT